MLISIEWHKNNSVQLACIVKHADPKINTVRGCSISLGLKVEADVLYPYNCNLAGVHIYSIDEYTASFEAMELYQFLVYLLQIIKHSQLVVSNSLLDLENGKIDKIRHCVLVFLDRGSSSRLSLPRLDSPAHFITMLCEGVSSPIVASMSWWTCLSVKLLRPR